MKHLRAGVALSIAAALALTACGRDDSNNTNAAGGETPAATVDDSPATGTITVWAMGEEAEKLPDFVEGFKKDNPDANVEVTAIPWADVRTKVQTAIAAGTVPDAIMIGSSQTAMLVATDGMAAVPEGLYNPSDYFEGAASSTQANGTEYAIPWYVETRVLYYRSDVAKDAGVSTPTNWQELTDFSKGLQTGGAKWGLQLPMGDAEDSTQVILPFYSQAGGSVLDDAGEKYTLDNQAMIDALNYYASFFKDGVSPTSGYGDDATGLFVNGSSPTMFSGPWMTNVFKDLKDESWVDQNVATAVVPAGSANNNSYIGGAHLGVFKDAKNADGAWKLIKWLSQPQTQQDWYKATNDLPALTSAWDGDGMPSSPRLDVLKEQLDHTIAPPAIPSWDELSSTIETEAEKVANDKTTAEDAAKAIQAKADSLGLGW